MKSHTRLSRSERTGAFFLPGLAVEVSGGKAWSSEMTPRIRELMPTLYEFIAGSGDKPDDRTGFGCGTHIR